MLEQLDQKKMIETTDLEPRQLGYFSASAFKEEAIKVEGALLETLRKERREHEKKERELNAIIEALSQHKQNASTQEELGDMEERYDYILQVQTPQSVTEVNKNLVGKLRMDEEAVLNPMPGWRVLTSARFKDLMKENPKRDVKVIALLGEFDKGKSMIINRLVGKNLPSSHRLQTIGLSIVYVEYEEKLFLFIDTAGSDAPIQAVDRESIQNKIAEEKFLKDLVYELADVFIYVVNEVTASEQIEIQALTEKLCNNKKSFSNLLVVHNFKNADTADLFNEMKKKYAVKAYSGDKPPVKQKVTAKIDGKLGEAYIEEVQHLRQRHYCLAREGTDIGKKNNPFVFELVRLMINSACTIDSEDRSSSLKDFEAKCLAAIKKHIHNYVELRDTKDGEQRGLNLEIVMKYTENARESYIQIQDPNLRLLTKQSNFITGPIQRNYHNQVMGEDYFEPLMETYVSSRDEAFFVDIFCPGYTFGVANGQGQNEWEITLTNTIERNDVEVLQKSRKDKVVKKIAVPETYDASAIKVLKLKFQSTGILTFFCKAKKTSVEEVEEIHLAKK